MKTRLAQASRSYLSRMLRKGVFVLLVGVWLGIVAARAQNASWLFSPGSSDWNTAANWAPATVPTGIATFGASNTTTITFSNNASVGTLHFKAGAPAYSFNLSDFDLTITGTGIVNNSSNRPTFTNTNGGGTEFLNTSTAGTATITTNIGALTFFYDSSTAGTATITTNFDAATVFVNTSTAGAATIITNNRGATDFFNTSTAGNATITTNAGGGTFFNDSSTGGQARFITNAGGIVRYFRPSSDGMTAGSIEGAGTYRLGSKALTVGLNNLSTEVSGTSRRRCCWHGRRTDQGRHGNADADRHQHLQRRHEHQRGHPCGKQRRQFGDCALSGTGLSALTAARSKRWRLAAGLLQAKRSR